MAVGTRKADPVKPGISKGNPGQGPEKKNTLPSGTPMNTPKRILAERARRLAEQSADVSTAEKIADVVEFLIGKEKYAIDIANVREVCPLARLTAVPCTPPFVLGIINLRGQMVSIIDLRKFFEMPDRGLADNNKVVIVRSGGIEVGILADAVLGTRTIGTGEFQQQLPTLTGVRERYLRGVTRDQTVLLDADKLLADRTIIVNDEA